MVAQGTRKENEESTVGSECYLNDIKLYTEKSYKFLRKIKFPLVCLFVVGFM